MSLPTVESLLEVAVDAAYLAGQRTLAWFQAGVDAEYKSDDTPVTIADRAAERVLRERILASFPDHAILGEEEGETAGRAPYRWVVDPIDGTKAFVSGVPLYGTLVGVEHDGRSVAGACWWNGRRCHVSEKRDLSRAVVVCSSIVRSQQRSDAFEQLTQATYLQRTWGDAFGYALAATGRVDIMLDPVKAAWDVGPMPVIFREAGGQSSTWSGDDTIYGRDYVATNGHLHDQVLDILVKG